MAEAGYHKPADANSDYINSIESSFKNYKYVNALLLEKYPKNEVLDVTRGLLPVATHTNVGFHGSAQAIQDLIIRLDSCGLQEGKEAAQKLRFVLLDVAPELFPLLKKEERYNKWVEYKNNLVQNKTIYNSTSIMNVYPFCDNFIRVEEISKSNNVLEDLASAIAFERNIYSPITNESIDSLILDYSKGRLNRRHKLGRAFEFVDFTFKISCDYATFRDLQRHRIGTIEWKPFDYSSVFEVPKLLWNTENIEAYKIYKNSMKQAFSFAEKLPWNLRQYTVPMGFSIEFRVKFNLRELAHVIELRTQPQGHANYRYIAQQMYRAVEKSLSKELTKHVIKFANLG